MKASLKKNQSSRAGGSTIQNRRNGTKAKKRASSKASWKRKDDQNQGTYMEEAA
jgi:hypothetical protein